VGNTDFVRIILASASAQRADILKKAGFSVLVKAAFFDEEEFARAHKPSVPVSLENAKKYVQKLALEKLQNAIKNVTIDSSDVVVAADTIVLVDGQFLEKPKDKAECIHQHNFLNNKTNHTMTAIAVAVQDTAFSFQHSGDSEQHIASSRAGHTEFSKVISENNFKIAYGVRVSEVFIGGLSGCVIDQICSNPNSLNSCGFRISERVSEYAKFDKGCYNNILGLDIDLLNTLIKQVKGVR